MHIHFEKSINGKCDCNILSMSWMGKVPDELPEDEGWKLNRTHYYQEGWLATGNIRGILGVTFTTSHWRKNSNELPHRTNYNLRGHRAQITLVQWNEPYQKLASCDSSGIIFVWIKYEGRWSIELINDRSTPVTHFSWSHDGRMALICYQDGFVLVGSVAGQRYWSSMLNLEATIMCGIWTPDDQHVYFGTSNAQVIVMDVHGTMVSQIQLPVQSSIRSMAWSCEKFKMEENEDGEPSSSSSFSNRKEPFVLAIAFQNGLVYLMRNYDDISPTQIWTGMQGLLMEWSNSGEYLAVAGSRPVEVVNESGFRVHEYFNSVYFYSQKGVRVLNIVVPATATPVTALTWGHNDKRLFVATGKIIHVGWVSKRVASLQLLCRLAIYKSLSNKSCVAHLPLPLPVRALISSLHTQTIVSILPNPGNLREFVSHPPNGNLRLYCTMIRHEEDTNQSPGTSYTLYLEYLGGLVPILKGKRTSKIRPEFVIYDPQSTEGPQFGLLVRSGDKASRQPPDIVSTMLTGRSSPARLGGDLAHSLLAFSDSSESEDVELCASPHMQRRRYRNRLRERERERLREQEREWEQSRNGGQPIIPDPATLVNPQHLIYNDVLPEAVRLVGVTSNIWGTKFKIHGMVSSLPDNLGSVTYKTSLLHLQPRQMTLVITELRDDIFLSSDAGFRNSQYQEDDEEDLVVVTNNAVEIGPLGPAATPQRRTAAAQRTLGLQKRFASRLAQTVETPPPPPPGEDPEASQDETEDEFPYVDLGLLNDGEKDSEEPEAQVITEVQVERNQVEAPGPSRHRRPVTASIPSNPNRKSWIEDTLGELPNFNNNNNNNPAQQPQVRRSFSASLIDGVEPAANITLDVASRYLRENSQPKRLVLVKKKKAEGASKRMLKDCGKSKSWDSYDLSWWKRQSSLQPPSSDSKGCPHCKFPSKRITSLDGKPKKESLTVSAVATPRPNRCQRFQQQVPHQPHTPIKRKLVPGGNLLVRRQESIEDKIESVLDAAPIEASAVTVEVEGGPKTPKHTPPPTPTPSHHRLSFGLLTPLLKRRELARNPKSSSFIPPASPQHLARSNPSTPPTVRKSKASSYLATASSPFRQLLANSPLLGRRRKDSSATAASSDQTSTPTATPSSSNCNTPGSHRRKWNRETQTAGPGVLSSSDEDESSSVCSGTPRTLRKFAKTPSHRMSRAINSESPSSSSTLTSSQRSQLRQKLSNKKIHNVENSPVIPRRMEFVMHNKAPMWNENSQVYQLDFGGRVTQESAKNFQIEFRGKQVMQFGRIDGNAYTMDFQYPFSALQAFAVALANVTQRLK